MGLILLFASVISYIQYELSNAVVIDANDESF